MEAIGMTAAQEKYRLSGGSQREAVALDVDDIEARVEQKWFSAQVDRKLLKELMKRSDGPGLGNFGLWIALLVASGTAGFFAWGTWWAVPAFFVYGTLYSSSDARWHECGHGTPFKTRWLNEAFYHLSSFMTFREAYLWRWSHARHHTHTIHVGADPEIQVTRPADLLKILADYFWIYSGPGEVKRVVLHACGIIGDAKEFMPPAEQRKMVWSSRAYVAIIGGTGLLAVAVGSFLPMMYVLLPRFYCGWHHQLCGLTQHAGLAENVKDHRLNTRTVYMNPVYRFLYLNMNYHIEHHMFPMVPYHALPRLHEAVKDQLPRTYSGVIEAYREIIPALIRQSRDPDYYVRRELSASQFAVA
jgi:fatty acid desaturase